MKIKASIERDIGINFQFLEKILGTEYMFDVQDFVTGYSLIAI